jgi:hypothetical protein
LSFFILFNTIKICHFYIIVKNSCKFVSLFVSEIEVNAGSLYDTQGPVFTGEPLPKVEFTNSSGGRVDCSARGNPEPTVEWLGPDNLAVSSIPGIRIVLNNGSIYFPPFEAEVFRQDVHWAVYRCLVANSVGTIVSREVTVRAGKFHRCSGSLVIWQQPVKNLKYKFCYNFSFIEH